MCFLCRAVAALERNPADRRNTKRFQAKLSHPERRAPSVIAFALEVARLIHENIAKGKIDQRVQCATSSDARTDTEDLSSLDDIPSHAHEQGMYR